MTVRIHAVCSPADRDALEVALAVLGPGWDRGDNLTPHATGTTPGSKPAPERYLLSAQVDDAQAARLVAILDAAGATWGKGLVLAAEDKDAVELKPGDDAAAVPVDKRRETMSRVLATHAAKPQDGGKAAEPK